MGNRDYLKSETFCTTLQTLMEDAYEGKVDKSGMVIYFSPRIMEKIREEQKCETCIFANYCSDEYIACE